jgi:hypothetical protein
MEIHAPSDYPQRWHRVIGHSVGELERQQSEMIASGKAGAGDGFIQRLIVQP